MDNSIFSIYLKMTTWTLSIIFELLRHFLCTFSIFCFIKQPIISKYYCISSKILEKIFHAEHYWDNHISSAKFFFFLQHFQITLSSNKDKITFFFFYYHTVLKSTRNFLSWNIFFKLIEFHLFDKSWLLLVWVYKIFVINSAFCYLKIKYFVR